ncbi:MAG: hypothetical protein ACKV2U_12390 [Bryobacteraceae bacterium]
MLQNSFPRSARIGFTLIVSALHLMGQSPSVKQDAKNASCSDILALAGNINLTCSSLTTAQLKLIESIPALLNRILPDQVNPQDLISVLNELKSGQLRIENGVLRIEQGVRRIQDNQGWLDLTTEQFTIVVEAARPFAGQSSVIDVPYWERDTERLARQLAGALTSVNWSAPVEGQGQMRFYSPNANLPTGIVVSRKDDTPAFIAIATALTKILGQGFVGVYRDASLPAGLIKLTVSRKP